MFGSVLAAAAAAAAAAAVDDGNGNDGDDDDDDDDDGDDAVDFVDNGDDAVDVVVDGIGASAEAEEEDAGVEAENVSFKFLEYRLQLIETCCSSGSLFAISTVFLTFVRSPTRQSLSHQLTCFLLERGCVAGVVALLWFDKRFSLGSVVLLLLLLLFLWLLLLLLSLLFFMLLCWSCC